MGESPNALSSKVPSQLKPAADCSFKPFLYKDSYRNKVQSVVRSHIDEHKAKHLATTDRSLINKTTIEQSNEDFVN